MTNWKKLADARGLDPNLVGPLESLERVFRPLVAQLGPADETDPVFRTEGDGE
jgi:hypothetical protein